MTRSWAVTLCLGLCAGAVPAAAGTLPEDWTKNPIGSPDGAALGDMDGDGRKEVALVLRSGSLTGMGIAGSGTLVVLDDSGALRWEVQTGAQLVGFPTLADFDGDGADEVAICEVSAAGYCRVYDADATLLFSVGPFGWPGMTNGGAAAADINGDGYADLIVASYAGEVQAAYGPMGATAWTYDMYCRISGGPKCCNANPMDPCDPNEGDYPFGHVAVADMDGDGSLEIAIGGVALGGIYVLNAEDGSEQWQNPPLIYAQSENYFYGSGPIFMNLDGDPQLEVVAAMAGYPGPAAVVAYETDGTFKWRTPMNTSEPLLFTTPSGADTNGDGLGEVFVQTFNGPIVRLRAADGMVEMSRSLGESSWASPSFVDIDFDASMEVITSTLSTTYLLDGNLSEIDRYASGVSGTYPPAVIGDMDGDGGLELVTGTWYPPQVVGLTLPYQGAVQWSAFGGSAQHAGSIAAGDVEVIIGDDIATGLYFVEQALQAAIGSTSGRVRRSLQNASSDVVLGYRQYLRGDPHLGTATLYASFSDFQQAQSRGYDTQQMQQFTAFDCLLMLEQYIDRSVAVAGTGHNAVQTAMNRLASGQGDYGNGDYQGACNDARLGATTLRNFLDGGGYPVANFCPATIGEAYMAWVCRLNVVRDQVQLLMNQYPSENNLDQADAALRSCLVWMPDLVLETAYPFCTTADRELGMVAATNVDALRDDLSFAIMRSTRLYLDDSGLWFSSLDPSAYMQAEAYYGAGVTAYQSGNYASAMDNFVQAQGQAQPCSSNAGGLEGGGCSP